MAGDIQALIQRASYDKPELIRDITGAVGKTPQYSGLFASIAQHVIQISSSTSANGVAPDGRPTKRARLDDGDVSSPQALPNGAAAKGSAGQDAGRSAEDEKIALCVPDLSFTAPQRRKLSLELTPKGLRARNATGGTLAFVLAWDDIQHAICVPVPDKAQRQYNFCIFPSNADGVSVPPNHPSAADAIVWTVSDGTCDSATGELAQSGHDTFKSLLMASLDRLTGGRVKVVEPDESEFASNIVQSNRKGEKAMHVKAFRGSKDGYLFFLPTGILWAFKKPLLFFSFDRILAISYTSVLQRTFNLNITSPSATTTTSEDNEETTEYEFSMIDQEDYSPIDAYVKRHGLQDASMAERRKAKVIGGQGESKYQRGQQEGEEKEDQAVSAMNGEVEGGEDVAEEDDEDEEGEDYDPGSEGESEGSGTETSDEEGGYARDGMDGIDDEDEDEEHD